MLGAVLVPTLHITTLVCCNRLLPFCLQGRLSPGNSDADTSEADDARMIDEFGFPLKHGRQQKGRKKKRQLHLSMEQAAHSYDGQSIRSNLSGRSSSGGSSVGLGFRAGGGSGSAARGDSNGSGGGGGSVSGSIAWRLRTSSTASRDERAATERTAVERMGRAGSVLMQPLLRFEMGSDHYDQLAERG